jgi:hypothetical protein
VSVTVPPPLNPVYASTQGRRVNCDETHMSSARPRRSATTMVADHNDHEQASGLAGADQQGAGGLLRTENAADAEEEEEEEKLLPWQA